ncbi:MAG: hypothetical protein NUW01_10440, partial [Gemmatimonadaceae bacterium]|nr:hypothetical protein [Gemmatimonadaceae bacterium]
MYSTADFSARRSPVFAARLRGAAIRFALVDRNGNPRAFTGRVAGDAMQGVSHWPSVPQCK